MIEARLREVLGGLWDRIPLIALETALAAPGRQRGALITAVSRSTPGSMDQMEVDQLTVAAVDWMLTRGDLYATVRDRVFAVPPFFVSLDAQARQVRLYGAPVSPTVRKDVSDLGGALVFQPFRQSGWVVGYDRVVSVEPGRGDQLGAALVASGFARRHEPQIRNALRGVNDLRVPRQGSSPPPVYSGDDWRHFDGAGWAELSAAEPGWVLRRVQQFEGWSTTTQFVVARDGLLVELSSNDAALWRMSHGVEAGTVSTHMSPAGELRIPLGFPASYLHWLGVIAGPPARHAEYHEYLIPELHMGTVVETLRSRLGVEVTVSR